MTVEGAWISVNLVSLVVTGYALIDAVKDFLNVRRLNGQSLRTASLHSIRREALRVSKVVALIILSVPALRAPGDTNLSPLVLALFYIALALLLNSLLDVIERRSLNRSTTSEFVADLERRLAEALQSREPKEGSG